MKPCDFSLNRFFPHSSNQETLVPSGGRKTVCQKLQVKQQLRSRFKTFEIKEVLYFDTRCFPVWMNSQSCESFYKNP